MDIPLDGFHVLAIANSVAVNIGVHVSKKHMKRYPVSLIIQEMQIKTTMRYHFTQVRMAITKKITNNKYWRKENPPTPLVGM